MRKISTDQRCLRFVAFFYSVSLLFFTAYCDDPPNPKTGTGTENRAPSHGRRGSTIAIICLLLIAVAALSFLLFRFWQKKKREEQYARLLKLFEEDDELELELGLRD